jgi:hypothetical protein
MSANGRIFRSKAGVLVPTDDAPAVEGVQVGREVSMRVIGDERFDVRQVAPRRESDAAPAVTPATPSSSTASASRRSIIESNDPFGGDVWLADVGDATFVAGKKHPVVREPALEARAEGWSGHRIPVLSVFAGNRPDVGGFTDAKSYVALNTASRLWRCPITRLAVLAHELEHVTRGDTHQQHRDEEAEADCEDAAKSAIVGAAAEVDRKSPDPSGRPMDAGICTACYSGLTKQCRQSESVLARVLTAFAKLMGIDE